MIEIRDAGHEDVDGIAKVHVQTWRSTYAGVLPDAYLVGLSAGRHAQRWRGWLERREQGDHAFVAAGETGEILGFASCGPVRDDVRFGDQGKVGEVYTLYVALDFQGQGLGRGLLTQCFAALAADRCDRVVLWVLEDNPSRFFYEAMGGQRLGQRQERVAGNMMAELAYGWDSVAADQGGAGIGGGKIDQN